MSELKTTVGPALEDRIRAAAEEVVQASDLFVVDVQVRGKKGSRVVEVYVDSDEGIDVEDLARVSRELGFLLDTDEIVDGRYNLNVSSPGADRPLVLLRQFRKHIGRKLAVRVRSGADERTVSGELTSVGDAGIALRLAPSNVVDLPFEEIEEARVVLPW